MKKKKKKIISEEEKIFLNNLRSLMNQLLEEKEILKSHMLSKLVLLNKAPEFYPEIDKIRPINISSPIIKLLEIIIKERILKTIKLNKSQIGFTKKSGTELGLMLIKNLAENKKKKSPINENCAYLSFIDLKQAFDSIDHDILMKKLREHEVEENLINLIQFIYSNTYSKISYEQKENTRINKEEVIQGSPLSPLLFNIYIDSLLNEIERTNANIIAFADDIVIINESHKNTKLSLDKLQEWCKTNKMEINKNKSNIIKYIKRERLKKKRNKNGNIITEDMEEEINGINFTKKYKYLGIMFNDKLDPQIENLEIKRDDFYKLIQKFPTNKISIKFLIQLWEVFFKSTFLYGVEAVMSKKKNEKKILDIYKLSLKKSINLPLKSSTKNMLYYTRRYDPKIDIH